MKRETPHSELLTRYGSSLPVNPFARSFGTGIETAVRQLAWVETLPSNATRDSLAAYWTNALCEWIDAEYFVS